MDITSQTLQQLVRGSLDKSMGQMGFTDDAGLKKVITTSTGLVHFDLQAPEKNLYPVYTPLRDSLPRPKGSGGTATNWRVVSSIVGSGNKVMPWVPEGQRSAAMSYVTANKAANYATIGEEDSITFEAINAAENFSDEYSAMNMRLLQKIMQKEEISLFWGNNGLSLGQVGTVTTSAGGSGATLPTATYYVAVAALTGEGYYVVGGSPANSLIGSNVITGRDGKTYTLNGGVGNPSAEVSQAITLGQILSLSWPAVLGAVAYAVFIGTATGGETLQFITTINSLTVSAPLATGRQAVTAFTGNDYSKNSLAFDGLYSTVCQYASAVNITTLATGTAGTGTVLTASGRGSCNELDTALKAMWDNYLMGPDVIWVNSQEQKNLTTKCLSNTAGPLLRVEAPNPTEPFGFVANNVVRWYFNPYAAGSEQKIPVNVHPNVPPGTIIMWSSKLPPLYKSNEVPNVAEVRCRKDYQSTAWPIVTRARDVGVYAEEVLAVYAPFALWAVTNIANG